MAKIRMNTLGAGPEGIRHPGHVYDVDAKEAKALVKGDFAEYVKEENSEKGVDADGTQTDNGSSDGTGDSAGD